MSGLICECNENVKNLGLPNCIEKFGRPFRITFVPLYKEDGTENFIDTSTATLNKAFFDALQYNDNRYARYFPVPVDMKNVNMPKGDAVYEEFDDGSKEFVRYGSRTFEAIFKGTGPAYIGKINSHRCGKLGVLITSDTLNLGGYEKSKGKLYPLPLADSTLHAMFAFKSGNTNEGGALAFEFLNTVLDEKFSWISSSDIGIDLINEWKGMRDTTLEQVAALRSTTTFTVDITQDFGTIKTKTAVEGLVAADFVLYNVTDAGAVTISTCVESTTVPGRYAFTFTAQTNTDILRLSLGSTDAAKPFDDAGWEDVAIALQ
ncbi:MAG TPA: hypothetical protein VGF79_00845 [Bacteroidia bacterium]